MKIYEILEEERKLPKTDINYYLTDKNFVKLVRDYVETIDVDDVATIKTTVPYGDTSASFYDVDEDELQSAQAYKAYKWFRNGDSIYQYTDTLNSYFDNAIDDKEIEVIDKAVLSVIEDMM